MYAHHLQTVNSIRGPLDKTFLSRFFLAHLHMYKPLGHSLFIFGHILSTGRYVLYSQ